MSTRRALLAKLHIARKELGLDESTYRAVLERVTGEESAAQLDDTQIVRVLEDLKSRGWIPKVRADKPRTSSTPHVRKIWALWNDMCRAGIPRTPTRAALRAFVETQTGVADPEWLTPEQASAVTEALKAWQRRELAKAAPKE